MVSTEINEFCILLFVAASSLQNFFLESKSWSGICLAASFWYILYEHFGIDREGRSSHSSRFSYFRKRKSKNTTLGVRFERYRVLLAQIYVCISRFGYLLKECPSFWGVEHWWLTRFLLLFWISWFLDLNTQGSSKEVEKRRLEVHVAKRHLLVKLHSRTTWTPSHRNARAPDAFLPFAVCKYISYMN